LEHASPVPPARASRFPLDTIRTAERARGSHDIIRLRATSDFATAV